MTPTPSNQGPITVDQLVARVLGTVAPLPPRAVALLDAVGLICREEVRSTLALPGFDNSAMDGYAVVAADVASADDSTPVTLPVVGEIGAGRPEPGLVGGRLEPGAVVKIMTGAPVPDGADAVVPYEWTDRGVTSVVITQAPKAGQHIRRAGDDIEVGDLVVPEGVRLTGRHLGLLAAVGRAQVVVQPRPRVVVLSTGSEVREPGSPLGPDSVYDANSFLVAAAVRAAGGVPLRVGVVSDDPARFLQVMRSSLSGEGGADLVVTSGGVSQGDFDVVKAALREEPEMWFGPVKMQPGKPQGFGTIPSPVDPSSPVEPVETPRRVPVFAVPGNPVSSYISTEVLVVPAIRRMLGLTPERRPRTRAMLTEAMRSPAGREQYARARWTPDGRVTPVGGPGSHLLGGLAGADALIVVPADASEVAAGEVVEVLRLDEPF